MKDLRRKRWIVLGLCSLVLLVGAASLLVQMHSQRLDLPGKAITPVAPSVYEPWLERARKAWEVAEEKDGFACKAREYGLLCSAGQFEAAEALRTGLPPEQAERLLISQASSRCDLGDYSGALAAIGQIETEEVADRARHQMALFYLPEDMLDASLRLAGEIQSPRPKCGALLRLAERAARQGDISRAKEILGKCEQEALPEVYYKTKRRLACFEAMLAHNSSLDVVIKSHESVELATMCHWLGDCGEFERAVAVAGHIPLVPQIRAFTGLALKAHRRNDTERARNCILRAEELAREYERLKLARAPEVNSWGISPKDFLGGVAEAMARIGMKNEAVHMTKELRDSPEASRNSKSCIVDIFLLCGKPDAAAAYERLHPGFISTPTMIKYFADEGRLEDATRLIESCSPDKRAEYYLLVASRLIKQARE